MGGNKDSMCVPVLVHRAALKSKDLNHCRIIIKVTHQTHITITLSDYTPGGYNESNSFKALPCSAHVLELETLPFSNSGALIWQ